MTWCAPAGSAAIAEVLASARPLADMLWTRETEAGSFDTPERRAAIEARMVRLAASIGDEAVRKHYRQDLEDRLRGLFRNERAPADQRPFQRGPQRAARPQLAAARIWQAGPGACAA